MKGKHLLLNYLSNDFFHHNVHHKTIMKLIERLFITQLWLLFLLTGLSLVTFPTLTFAFAIGDEHAGGIIFYINDSGSHGLVASDTDIRGTRSWDEAMAACKNYKKNGYSDWFLPDREQLAELYLRRSVVGGLAPNNAYWSSTESDLPDCAWLQYFSTGAQYRNFTKNYLFYVRAVRAF